MSELHGNIKILLIINVHPLILKLNIVQELSILNVVVPKVVILIVTKYY